MENIKTFVKKYKNILFPFFVTLIFFIGFCKVEYSRCTFRMYINDANVEYKHFLTLGRYILALWWKIVSVLKFNLTQTYIISYIMSIIFMTLSIYKTKQIVQKLVINKDDKKIKIIVNIVSILIPLNPFVIELFLYLEKGIMIMALFFAIFAVEKIMNYFDNKKKVEIIKSFIYILVSSFCYQGSTLIYLSFAFVLVIKYSKSIKEFIYNNIIISIPFVLGYGINFLCIKLFFTSTRISGNINLIESFNEILKKLPQMLIDNFGTLPKYTIIISLTIILGIIIWQLINLKNSEKLTNIKNILAFIYIICAILFVTLIPQLILDVNSIQILARSSISFGCIIGILYIFILSEFKLDKIKVNILLYLSIFLILIEYVYMQKIIIDHYKLNKLDIELAQTIDKKIDEYEKEYNIQINKIIFYSDRSVENSYPNIKNYYQINSKVINIPGRNLELIEFVSGRKYECSYNVIEEYEKYFKENNWDYFDNDQLIFKDDTLHLCIF